MSLALRTARPTLVDTIYRLAWSYMDVMGRAFHKTNPELTWEEALASLPWTEVMATITAIALDVNLPELAPRITDRQRAGLVRDAYQLLRIRNGVNMSAVFALQERKGLGTGFSVIPPLVDTVVMAPMKEEK